MSFPDPLPPARAWLSDRRALGRLRAVDQRAIGALHRLRGHGRLDGLFVVASERPPRLALAVVGAGLVSVHRGSARPAVAAAAAATAAQLIAESAKRPVRRRRPSQSNPGVALLADVPHSTSFPSSHAATAFAVARALQPFAPDAAPFLHAAAGTIALSRSWLGVHYLSDVLAGSLIGFTCGAAAGKLAA